MPVSERVTGLLFWTGGLPSLVGTVSVRLFRWNLFLLI